MATSEEIRRAVALYDRAFEELRQHGRVVSVQCDACQGLLEITPLSESAWSVNCPCGRYRDTLRGL